MTVGNQRSSGRPNAMGIAASPPAAVMPTRNALSGGLWSRGLLPFRPAPDEPTALDRVISRLQPTGPAKLGIR
jgi:hypothetical protein